LNFKMPEIKSSQKLSSIVAYMQSIGFDDIWKYYKDSNNMLYTLMKTIDHSHYLDPTDFGHEQGQPWQDQIDLIRKDYEDILSSISNLNDNALRLRDIIKDTIKEDEQQYFEDSYTIYNQGKNDTPDFILDRTSRVGEHYYDKENDLSVRKEYRIADTLKKRISLYSSWKYSGMHIRPGRNKITEHIVALDPLYIVDEHMDLLKPTMEDVSAEYRNRLRFKTIHDSNEIIYKEFPQSQLGFILITDFFNYKPLEIIKKHLSEMWGLLKPGGVILFTYNNCELPHAIKNVEKKLSSYIPKRYLLPFLESIGYDILYTDDKDNISWVEIQKPGNVISLRGGQSIAKINT